MADRSRIAAGARKLRQALFRIDVIRAAMAESFLFGFLIVALRDLGRLAGSTESLAF